MGASEAPHRLDGFDADQALDDLRALRREIGMDDGQATDYPQAARGEKMAELFDLLDHWLILGCDPPAEWRWPAPELAGARIMLERRQPKRVSRAKR
jgi:hypothetical protein